MSRFSETLMDHFVSPRNRGRLEQPDAVGRAGTPGQGRSIAIYLKGSAGRVTAAMADCCGCGVTIACGSAVTELIIGHTWGECWALTPQDIADALDGIPPDKQDRAAFAIHALRDALKQLPV